MGQSVAYCACAIIMLRMQYRTTISLIATILVATVLYANVSYCPIIFEKVSAKEHDCCKRSKGQQEEPAKKACPNPDGSTPDKKDAPQVMAPVVVPVAVIDPFAVPPVRPDFHRVQVFYSPPDLLALQSAFLI